MDTIRENLLELTDSSIGTNGYVRIVGADGSSYRMAIQDFINLVSANPSIAELITAEAEAREAADEALAVNFNGQIETLTAAIALEAELRAATDSSEAQARANADAAINEALDALDERVDTAEGDITELKADLSNVSDALGTFLRSYVVNGRVKFDKYTILQSAKPQSGNYTFYKFTRNFFFIPNQTINGVTITHDTNGKIILNGTSTSATSIDVLLPVNLSGQFYGYLSASSTKTVGIHLRNTGGALAAAIYLNNSTTASFDRNVSNINKYQFYIAANQTFDNYVVEASVTFLYNENSASNSYEWEEATMIEVANFPIRSRFDYYLSALTLSQILLDTEFSSGFQEVRVSKTCGADYSTILEALKSTPDYVKVYVENGTYNIVDEYKSIYGADFWSNYDGYANHANDPFYRGLWISDNRVIEFDAWAKVVWDYDGANTSVNGLFSVFATGQNATIINAHVIFNSNCRYAIHDDYAAFGGTNKFIRCIFNGTSSNGTTIGGGCGHRNTYVVKDCLFLNDGTYDISYHNTSGLGINHIVVTGCNGGGQLKFGWYGDSTEITECIASNNKFGSIVCVAHNSSAINENMKLRAWNNVVSA